jgi:poly-gamma-glutamate capsule biosynthesis protein CapA/YwtB (metallophosphatase superfamily)
MGDIYLGPAPAITLAPELAARLHQADLVLANLESPLLEAGREIGGKCCLKSSPRSAAILRDWGIDVLSVANNHIFDFGREGLDSTFRTLGEAGIAYLGAGENLAQARRPLICELNGLRVGLLAHSWEFVQTTCATENSPGCAPLDVDVMTADIAELAGRVDAVILLPHWGFCDYVLPAPEQVVLARRLVEAGATAVIGHHSHAVQGIWPKQDRLVAYSLGNFAFAPYGYRGVPELVTRDSARGMIILLTLEPGRVANYEILFTANRGGVIGLDDSPGRREELDRRSRPLQSDDYPAQWLKFIRRRMLRRVLHYMNVLNWQQIHKETFLGVLLMVRNAWRRR